MGLGEVTPGFRWCPHCRGPHKLSDRVCAATRKALGGTINIPTPAPCRSLLEGLVLDAKYRLLRPIGAGGMGEVFEAESLLEGNRLVAVKVVFGPPRPETLVRLEREARDKTAGTVGKGHRWPRRYRDAPRVRLGARGTGDVRCNERLAEAWR